MKIYVKCEDVVSDSFKVGRIYIVDNAVTATLKNLYISATRREDDFYELYDDEELLSLSVGEIRSIRKEEVLDRINELFLQGEFDQNPLTEKQQKLLSDWYRFGNPKGIITDVEPILDAIKSSISVNKPFDRTEPDEQWKNYAQSKGINLNMDDYLMMLKHLNKSHFKRELKSSNTEHLGNRLLEFELSGTFVTHDNTELSNVIIYIKIEKQISNGHIVLISFHDPEHRDTM